MGKKYKVTFTPQVKKQISKLNKKDKKKIMAAIEKLAKNPSLGELMDLKEIKSIEFEKCECKKPYEILLDLNSDEVYFSCRNGKCDSFWMTKTEMEKGRKMVLKRKQSKCHSKK
ncbi:MAG: hypothetical protein WC308_04365 [archaeon]|jgi:mRNA-degrading endonuclease RelE of RelBE toxin-antitoxin system